MSNRQGTSLATGPLVIVARRLAASPLQRAAPTRPGDFTQMAVSVLKP